MTRKLGATRYTFLGASARLLTRLARPSIHHRFDGAHIFFLGGVNFGSCGGGGGLGGHDASLFLFDVDGGFLD
ncbi:MAG: hypothetical protein H7Y42_14045, partial [Chitinophagaceae bacterium]|nr:hypothetical protein [Chitinophagaceae bacterium]